MPEVTREPLEPIETFGDRLQWFHRQQIREELEAFHRLGQDGYLAWWAQNR